MFSVFFSVLCRIFSLCVTMTGSVDKLRYRRSVNVNHVHSVGENLPHSPRYNYQVTEIVLQISCSYIRTSLQGGLLYWQKFTLWIKDLSYWRHWRVGWHRHLLWELNEGWGARAWLFQVSHSVVQIVLRNAQTILSKWRMNPKEVLKWLRKAGKELQTKSASRLYNAKIQNAAL